MVENEENNITLQCFVWGDGKNDWNAICTDLDIAVQGQSLNETENILTSSIDEYIKEVLSLSSEEDQLRLLNRRAPFFVRMGIWFRFFFNKKHHKKYFLIGRIEYE